MDKHSSHEDYKETGKGNEIRKFVLLEADLTIEKRGNDKINDSARGSRRRCIILYYTRNYMETSAAGLIICLN